MWALRYLEVDTRNWWPGGKDVLIDMHWIDVIDWFAATVSTSLTRDAIRRSPAYDNSTLVHRSYEVALHKFYNREGYCSGPEQPPRPTGTSGRDD